MRLPNAFLFDLDGVLLDTEPLNRQTWKRTSSYFEYELSNNQLNTFLGKRKIDCVNDLIEWSQKKITVKEVLSIHKKIHEKILQNIKPINGAQELIEFIIKNKIPIALVTSSTYESVMYKCRDNKWIEKIKTRVYGDDPLIKKGKPNPDPYILASNRLGINANYCWAVEDSHLGCKSALDAGNKVFLLDNNHSDEFYKHQDMLNNNPIHIKNLNEILIFIRKLYSQ